VHNERLICNGCVWLDNWRLIEKYKTRRPSPEKEDSVTNKLSLSTPWRPVGEENTYLHSLLTSGVDEGEQSTSRLDRITPSNARWAPELVLIITAAHASYVLVSVPALLCPTSGTGKLAQSVKSRKVPDDVGPDAHYIAGLQGALQVRRG